VIRYQDRSDAGRLLARKLVAFGQDPDTIVLALPRGGVEVAFEIAAALSLPLDVLIVRKLGTPGQPELAMGAIASGGIRVLNEEVVRELGLGEQTIERVTVVERQEIERREGLYRGTRPPLDPRGRTVLLVDDGLATGSTMLAAIQALRARGPRRIIAAIPVAARESLQRVRAAADEVVCLQTPSPFVAIGAWYERFPQLDNDDVRRLLARSYAARGRAPVT
jgi:putative phosphoribosyl transferase